MRIYVISVCRNERDIIGAFLQHIGALFDGGLLIDHGSSDGTRETMQAFCADRDQSWRFGDLFGTDFPQAAVSSLLLREAFTTDKADAVIVLDADELLNLPDRESLETIAARLERDTAVGAFRWRNHVPVDVSQTIFDLNAKLWQGGHSAQCKILIPRSLWVASNGKLQTDTGSHTVRGIAAPTVEVGEIAHIPIRSRTQFRRKIANNKITNPDGHRISNHVYIDGRRMRHQELFEELLTSEDQDALIIEYAIQWRKPFYFFAATPSGDDHPYTTTHLRLARLPTTPSILPCVDDQPSALNERNISKLVFNHKIIELETFNPAERMPYPGKAVVETEVSDTGYSTAYFHSFLKGSHRSAYNTLTALLDSITFDSLLDVGCGHGTWSRAALDLGLSTVIAVDGDYIDRDELQIDPRLFRARDLADDPLKLDDGDPTSFDIVISMEVAEHLPAEASTTFVESLCSYTDLVLFSAAIPGQGGQDHVNEQWVDYWHARFSAHNFECFDLLRPKLWNDETIDYWYRQNALIYARCGSLAHRILIENHQPSTPLSLVHPAAFTNAYHAFEKGAEETWKQVLSAGDELAAAQWQLKQLRDNHEQELKAAQEENTLLHSEKAAANNELDALRQQLTILSQSRSWRLTTPLRQAGSLIRRFR